jgi:DNA-binding MarR family transcriptional regulator
MLRHAIQQLFVSETYIPMPTPQVHTRLPQTVTLKILKSGASNHIFRKLLYDFFTVSSRMEEVRSYLGSRLRVSGPQFTVLVAVAELEDERGVSVGKVGEYLHVTGTYITIESGKLRKQGYLSKQTSPVDRRVTLLSLTPKGVDALKLIAPELQKINDTFFHLESRTDFIALCGLLDRLVNNSERAVDLIGVPQRR